jgi:hypothetical protein
MCELARDLECPGALAVGVAYDVAARLRDREPDVPALLAVDRRLAEELLELLADERQRAHLGGVLGHEGVR